MDKILSIYGSHDSNITIYVDGKIRIYELERLTKIRNFNLSEKFKESGQYCISILEELYSIIKKDFGDNIIFDKFYHFECDTNIVKYISNLINLKAFYSYGTHHNYHLKCAIHQSNYDECLVFSYDAGGKGFTNEVETFCIFYVRKSDHVINQLASLPIDICGAYTMLAIPISEIHKEDLYTKYLTYAGKKMGLAAYGNINKDWVEPIKNFYYSVSTIERMKILGEKIGLNLSGINTISGQDSKDLAATSQYVFEELFFNAAMPFIRRYELPVILTGGGALNVLLNQKIKKIITKTKVSANESDFVFIPPNPNDCGISLGITLSELHIEDKINVQYSGFSILDIEKLNFYVEKYKALKVEPHEIAWLLLEGKVVGILNGNSEVGARALGNRSILAYPAFKEMKDKINEIKKREFYRPFAPVVRAEDMMKYFNFNGESTYMSFAPEISVDYVDKVPSIVHYDRTARVQSVTREQNVFIYQILEELERKDYIPMLLNTSFNIKGNPILTTIEDALHVLETTNLDAVYIEGYLFKK